MNVCNFLKDRGVAFEVLPHQPAYDAQHLAQSLHVPGCEVAKTVLLRANHRYGYMVAVLPATRRIDLERLSRQLCGCELELASEAEIAEHCPDCEFGVLPPFGSQYAMTTVVDESLANDPEIVFEGNTHEEAIRMRFRDYMRVEEPLILAFAEEEKSQGVA
jgi:Ala-tRNA(Pro) deacylase